MRITKAQKKEEAFHFDPKRCPSHHQKILKFSRTILNQHYEDSPMMHCNQLCLGKNVDSNEFSVCCNYPVNRDLPPPIKGRRRPNLWRKVPPLAQEGAFNLGHRPKENLCTIDWSLSYQMIASIEAGHNTTFPLIAILHTISGKYRRCQK